MPLPAQSLTNEPKPPWLGRYALAAGIVGGATVLRELVDPWLHNQIPYFIYVASVVVATWFCGIDGGIFSTILAAFVGNYLFVPPRYEWIPHGEDWLAMGMFAAVAGGLIWQVGRWRAAERVLERQARDLQEQGLELRAQADELNRKARTLEELHAEAERVNRVKDEFLATLSHELRTPLNAIVGWAHLLVENRWDEARRTTAAETILRNAHAQARLVEDLLDVSRIISGKLHLQMEPVDLGSVVNAAVELVRPAAEAKSIELKTSVPAAPMVGDAERLRQIAWNLLSNAAKFTPKHGRIEVRLDRVDSQLELTVSDTGIGVDAEFLPHLFERFSQADSSTTRRHGGLGLGLAVARHLAELHGGTVSAASRGRNAGSTFVVRLPVRAMAQAPGTSRIAGQDDERPAAPTPSDLRGVRVLVVDDEPDARELVETVLAQYGADVRAAASANEAFEQVRNWRPDVLVADIGMPGEDGYSLLRRVRALSASEGGSVPAAALTAYAHAEDRDRALSSGFQEHLPKPILPERLARVVVALARGEA